MKLLDFTEKTVFLTGGSGGIGTIIRNTFEECGAKVIAPVLDEMDMTRLSSVNEYFDRREPVDAQVFIHCAGINDLAGIDEIDEDLLERVFHVNCMAPALIMKRLVPAMKAACYGRVVLISSLYGIVSRERRIAYSSSKHALNGLMKSLALELGEYNILINAVAPGYVMTEMTRKNLSQSEQEAICRQIPTGRFQDAQEIANCAAFLCSSLNQSISGQLIAVDGGFTCH